MIIEWFFGKVADKVAGKAWDVVALGTKHLLARFRSNVDFESVKRLLNEHFAEEVEILRFNDQMPRLHILGGLEVDNDLRKAAAIHRARLRKQKRPDDECAILVRDANWQADPDVPSRSTSRVNTSSVLRIGDVAGMPMPSFICFLLVRHED